MLRIWQASAGGTLSWRATLESPHTGERHGFADLRALFAFLEEKTSSTAGDSASRIPTAPSDVARPVQLILDGEAVDATHQRLADIETPESSIETGARPEPEAE